MQKIINNPDNLVDEMVEGFLLVHNNIVAGTDNPRVIKYKDAPVNDKVGIVTGGGSGHKPAFIGYAGEGMADAVAIGEIFTSPSANSFYDAFHAADSGKGVACLYGNFSGDVMNVKMARELAEEDQTNVKTVIANDDVPSSPKNNRENRRGSAGEILMWKVGGARAALGGDLDEVIASAQKAIDNTRSVGIGLSACTIPSVGKPNFSIEPGKMEIGIGHHGEPGMETVELKTADEIASLSLDVILPDYPFSKGDEVVALISGLGATPLIEQYVYYRKVAEILKSKGISVYRSFVGNYFTSLEMKGVSLTLMKVDEELKELIDYPTDAVYFKQQS
ncbi:MAG: dihydroxyacetone kinase subunit DhaK [Bacteroidales bacterium]|nr:dihydroxyacetone kinase subunit DhaK [Bacteroidales bacterium]